MTPFTSSVIKIQNIGDMKSKQDYANWELTGRRFHLYCEAWSDDFEEYEEVISVNGEKSICRDCEKEKPGLKPICDTPSFHNSNFTNCLECTEKAVTKAGGKIFSEKDTSIDITNFLSN